MLGPEWLFFPLAPLPVPGTLLAYVGLGPGQEFIPYFLALLGFVGAALLAILQWPLLALRRLFRRTRGTDRGRPTTEADAPETPPEASPDKP